MAIYYKTADQLPLMEKVTDSTYAIVEENGTLKRVSGSNLGGSSIKTAIIKQEGYDEMLAYLKGETGTEPTIVDTIFTCTNMTFEEAYQIMGSGEPLSFMLMRAGEGCTQEILYGVFGGTVAIGQPIIVLRNNNIKLSWTEDGISAILQSSGAGS